MKFIINRGYCLVLIFVFFLLIFTGKASSQDNEEVFFPLVIFGGEPEGIMAAVAAAREGVETLLIMEREEPGGLMTYGGLNYLDINYGPDGSNLNQGLFSEWHHKVGGKISFSIKRAIWAFNELLNSEENLTVYKRTKLVSVLKEKNVIHGMVILKNNKKNTVKFERVIDATQNADLALKSGVPFFKGGADIGLPDRHMAVTLILHIGNVDWNKLKEDVKKNKFGPSYMNKDHAWGFVKVGQLYQPREDMVKLRGLNIVFDNNNNDVYINSLLIFGVNPIDQSSIQNAYKRGKREARYVLDFLKKNVSGFSDAYLLDFPEELYIRESRHMLAEYQLKTIDLWNNRIFNDTIALASYPLDYQASTPEYNGFVLFNPVIYGIPFRSLIPLTIENLLVVGRSSGYSSLAASSARVLPTGMSTGEAAGIASAISIKKGINYRELSKNSKLIKNIQIKLGINKYIGFIPHFNAINNIGDEFYPYFKELLSWGLIIGGYKNDFRLNGNITEKEFAYLILKGLQMRRAPILYEWVPGSLETLSSNKLLTRDRAAMLLLAAISKRVLSMEKKTYFRKALQYGLFPELIINKINFNRQLTRKEAYIIAAHFIDLYPLPESLKRLRGEE